MLRGTRRASLPVLALAVLAGSATAHAQTTQASVPRGALDQLDPAPAGDAFFSFPSADVTGRLRLSAQVLASYAHAPLVIRSTSGATHVSWVRDQAVAHVQASLEALGFLKLDLDMPFTMAAGGESGSFGNFSVTAPSGANAGDLRAGLRVVLLHQDGLVPSAAIGFNIWAPTGSATSFGGAGVVRYQPGISIGAEYAHLIWGAAVGARFQEASPSAVVGSHLVGGFGAAFLWRGLSIGPEVHFQVDTGDQRNPIVGPSSGVGGEVLLDARYRLGPAIFGLAGGPGVGTGPGTPRYRLLASVGVSFDVLPPGSAGDEDSLSRRGAAGDGQGQGPAPPPPAPPLDTDGDGVPDAEDACPTIIGDPSPKAYHRGCPPDRDRDGIYDVDDRCPDVPGVESADPSRNGCPADTDGDGITDDKDACPREKGEPSADPKRHGCPTSVRVEGTQIVILQQVNFETGRDTIKPDSFALLGQVAEVLAQHPEIARVAVDGHTDNRGGDRPNLNLSQRRAVAVVRWLVDHGVDARRLEARGFGQRRPIADNKTDEGRAKNRRVEFQIRKRTAEGEAGWRDGPIDDGAAGGR